MGIGGIGIWQLVIVLVIVMLLFGTKKLKNIGSDLGGALKGFKNAMDDGDKEEEEETKAEEKIAQNSTSKTEGETIDVTAEKVEEKS